MVSWSLLCQYVLETRKTYQAVLSKPKLMIPPTDNGSSIPTFIHDLDPASVMAPTEPHLEPPEESAISEQDAHASKQLQIIFQIVLQ